MSQSFDLQLRTRIVYGNDSVERLGQLTAELGKEMVRISTDPELVMIMSNAMRAYRGQ